MRFLGTKVHDIQACFCDWITISQTHKQRVPVVHDAVVQCVLIDGQLDWESVRGFKHDGTFDTRVLVTSDGNRVTVSGNVGRLNRPDNVFGYSVTGCIEIASRIAEQFGLPAFTKGDRALSNRFGSSRTAPTTRWTGATVSRLDMTTNFSTGGQVSDFLYWLSSQKLTRGETEMIGHTVYFGKHNKAGDTSTFAVMKAYNKAAELEARYKKLKRSKPTSERMWHRGYLEQLIQWATTIGIVRCEVTFKQRFLTQRGLRYIAEITDEKVHKEFTQYEKQMMKRIAEYADIRDLPWRLQTVYHAYMRGENLQDMGWSRSTFFRYRKDLLPTGIDIFKPLNVKAINVRPRLIEIKPVSIPDFYYRPMAA